LLRAAGPDRIAFTVDDAADEVIIHAFTCGGGDQEGEAVPAFSSRVPNLYVFFGLG